LINYSRFECLNHVDPCLYGANKVGRWIALRNGRVFLVLDLVAGVGHVVRFPYVTVAC
jgi:hypothetical protein